MEIDVLLDGGAYCTLTPVVLSRGASTPPAPTAARTSGSTAASCATNTPPSGAFRGFGAPQTVFAIERHMDRVAEALGVDPVGLREANALRPGDTMATGQLLGEDASALPVLREAVRAVAATTASGGPSVARTAASGSRSSSTAPASPGRARSRSRRRASLELRPRGVRVLVGSTEMGQGAQTTLAQIVAEALAWPVESGRGRPSRHRGASRTAGRPSRRAPAWWWAGC